MHLAAVSLDGDLSKIDNNCRFAPGFPGFGILCAACSEDVARTSELAPTNSIRAHHRNRKSRFFSERSGHRRAARKKFEGVRPHWRSEYPGRYHADDSKRDGHDGRGVWLGAGERIAL